jgi:hypothetical protein
MGLIGIILKNNSKVEANASLRIDILGDCLKLHVKNKTK